ncbi:ATP-binding cassette domain-containing protein [Micrococcaceae bacterium Sec5.1]
MDILRFVLVGIGAGALYALIAQGMVLVYRGSGVLNFAQGGFVMVGAYTYYQMSVGWGIPLAVALVGSVVAGAILGSLVQLLILRNMTRASPLLRVVATLALFIVLQALGTLIFGSSLRSVPSLLPTNSIEISAGVSIGADRLIILGVAIVSTICLWWFYKTTAFGRATSAVAENQLVPASLGHSPERIAVANWAFGAGLAALTGGLIGPITYLQPNLLAMLVIPALAVAYAANFRSFPVVLVAGLSLGVIEALMSSYVTIPGMSQSVPFIVVVTLMVLRGRGIPMRSYVLDRLPSVGLGRIPVIVAATSLIVLLALLTSILSPVWINAFTVTIGFMILCLSVVLITGYGGQLSLAQYSLAGFGALVAARLFSDWEWPFLLSVLGAFILTALLGALVALPALRTRGIDLAVVTLGLGVVLYNVVLNSKDVSGGVEGIRIPPIDVFGIDVSGLTNPEGYAIVAAILLFAVAIGLLNLRRGASGRRLLAVRGNERAAAALGVNVYGTKVFAFSAAAGIAALAGIMLTFRGASVVTVPFDPFQSIIAVAMTVVGGVGMVGGGIMGGSLISGGIGSELFAKLHEIESWLPLITGIVLLVILVRQPSGLWAVNAELARAGVNKMKDSIRRNRAAKPNGSADAEFSQYANAHTVKVVPRRLKIGGLRVAFGAVVAVSDATLTVEPGQVHGLIGPNGAGKTTVIDAASGFVKSTGTVTLGGDSLTGMSPLRRVDAGLARSFQSLELFEDLTVRENLAIACEDWNFLKYLKDFVKPGRVRLNTAAIAAAQQFNLMDVLDAKPSELPMGRRRLVAIARSIAAAPSVLCLDEPAAGLSDAEAQNLSVLLRDVARNWNMGILLVEHNVEMVVATCDVVTVLVGGSVLTSGPPEEVRSDERVLGAYLGATGTTDEHDTDIRIMSETT